MSDLNQPVNHSQTPPEALPGKWQYDLAIRFVDRCNAGRGRMQTKVGVVLGFSFAEFGLFLKTFATGYELQDVVVPFSAIVVAWVFLLVAYFTRSWPVGPSAEYLLWSARTKQAWSDFMPKSLERLDVTSRQIVKALDRQGVWFNWGLVMLLLSAVTAFATVFKVHLAL